MPGDDTSKAARQVLVEARFACAVLADRLKEAFAPFNSPIPPPQVALGKDGQQRLKRIADSLHGAVSLLASPNDRKHAYAALSGAFNAHCEALRWSHVGDWLELNKRTDAAALEAKAERDARQAQSIAAARSMRDDANAALSKHEPSDAELKAAEDPIPGIADTLRESATMIRDSANSLLDTIERMYRTLAKLQKQQDDLFRKEATSALRTAQRLFLQLRFKYWLLKSLSAAPYAVAVLLALLLMRVPSVDTTMMGGVAVLLLVSLGAIIKRYVSATIGQLIDKRIDELVPTALERVRHSFVMIEATLAAHEGLRSYFDDLGPALRERQAQALRVNDA